MRFIQFIIIFQCSNEFLKFKFGKRNFGKEKLMNNFGPHSAQGLATASQPTADSGLRGPCPRRAPARPNRGHHARGVACGAAVDCGPVDYVSRGVVAWAPGPDGEPIEYGGWQRGSPWMSDVGGAPRRWHSPWQRRSGRLWSALGVPAGLGQRGEGEGWPVGRSEVVEEELIGGVDSQRQ
jgi:hypothetical protein